MGFMGDRIVVAVGGNALAPDAERQSGAHQRAAAVAVARSLAALVADGHSVAITHGNGPQVGDALLASEIAAEAVEPQTLDALVAGTQGSMGYLLQQTLQGALAEVGSDVQVISVVTQVEVDLADPAFDRPSKPVGGVIPEGAVAGKRAEGWTIALDPGRGWRRVVPSPRPISIIEGAAIRAIVDDGIVVICGGGGGIPVVRIAGRLEGVAAVIDKDAVTAMVAEVIGADTLVFATSVDGVALNFSQEDERWLSAMTAAEASNYVREAQFAPGSMEPKIKASVAFLAAGGRQVVIGTPTRIGDSLAGRAGTRITP